MKKSILYVLIIVLLTCCTSIVEGTWTSENGDQIIIKQGSSDPNLGSWKYLSQDNTLYEGDYVIDGYGEEIGFKNIKGDPVVFMGKLKDGSLFFQRLDGAGGYSETEFTR